MPKLLEHVDVELTHAVATLSVKRAYFRDCAHVLLPDLHFGAQALGLSKDFL